VCLGVLFGAAKKKKKAKSAESNPFTDAKTNFASGLKVLRLLDLGKKNTPTKKKRMS
jgi:hypothetical protein